MSTVAEIKRAIEKLSPQERCELEALLHPWPEDDWDRQMQGDAEPGGKLQEMMSASRKNALTGKLIMRYCRSAGEGATEFPDPSRESSKTCPPRLGTP
jgi:hypothetical protein